MKSPSLEVFKISVDVALRDMVTGGLGNAGLAVGLNGLRGLFQMKQFYDSVVRGKELKYKALDVSEVLMQTEYSTVLCTCKLREKPSVV